MSSSAVIVAPEPLFLNKPTFGPVKTVEELQETHESLRLVPNPLRAKFHSNDYNVFVGACRIALTCEIWDGELPSIKEANNELEILHIMWNAMNRSARVFVDKWTKAPIANKPKETAHELKGSEIDLMKGFIPGDNMLEDRFLIKTEEQGGIPIERQVAFVREQMTAYSKPNDDTRTLYAGQRELRIYLEQLQYLEDALEDEENHDMAIQYLILVKEASQAFTQMKRRLAPPPAIPAAAAASPVKSKPKAKVAASSDMKKKPAKKVEEEEEMEVDEPKPKAKESEKKRKASNDDEEEEEEEKPKAKKAKAEPAPVPPAFSFKQTIKARTMEDASRELAEAGCHWLVSKTQQILKEDASPMIDFMGAVKRALEPSAREAIADKDSEPFVNQLEKLTAKLNKVADKKAKK